MSRPRNAKSARPVDSRKDSIQRAQLFRVVAETATDAIITIYEKSVIRFVDKENYAFFVYGDDSVRGCLGDDAEELCALNGILAGINWSCALGVPWSRHSRLITWSLSPQTLRIGAVRTKGFQPLAAMDTNECSIRT